jgi:hypothetical protein
MSPEQAKGESEDWRTDIFSFGIILYEIVCGRRPFVGANAHTVLYQIAHEDPVAPSSVNAKLPPAVETVILRCLRKDRADRPQSMEEVARALAGLPDAARPPSRRRTLVGAAAGLGALAFGLGIWQWRKPSRIVAYRIEAQKMNDGEPAGEPYTTSAADNFEAGWRFRLRIRPGQPGWLYVINEGPGDSGAVRYWVLYPKEPLGSPLPADQEVVTGWYVFDRNPGTERLWLVSSDRALPWFDDILREGRAGEVISPVQAGRIKSILTGLARPAGSTATPPSGTVQWRAAEGVMGGAIELRHR